MVRSDKNRLFYLSWLTLFGMSAMGIVIIHYVQGRGVQLALLGGKAYYKQALTGMFFGSLTALFGALLLKGKRFKATKNYFEDLIGGVNPSLAHIIFYSACAGIGEEILFRAGIQCIHGVGIWPAAILFVLLHGYLNPANFNLTVYGVFLIIISAGFGYLYKFFGLTAAVVAHFVYDVSMFSLLKYSYKKSINGTAPEQKLA